MRKAVLLLSLWATTLLFSVPPCYAAPLSIGVAPHTSARIILQMYQPLRQYLEKTLGREVDVVTAPDFNDFVRRGLTGTYDIAITTSHQARLLQTDAGYIPLLTYQADFRSVALVAKSGPTKSAGDLKGKEVLGLSATSQVTLWGQRWLDENGIDARMKYVSASDSVAQLVAAGEAAAGFTSLANYQKLPDPLRAQLMVLAQSPVMPGRVYLLSPRLAGQRRQIEAALWSFAATPEARKYFDENKLQGYRKLKAKELASMDAYAAEVRKVIKGKTP
ncbi:phosphate/phosphite/phosphonate ABC transporter substrate-binding protein [Geomonas agri]|uniref:phosphate/phosphite/phosphonate ABC transporter substrate-binding protein n=1 Tax=Geomonas agri TaxID=2873702 RepID=UPI001CD6DBBB|nr:phosphate/phosphite/phosphonate ABC transporter substrate-binding protein [Geomonas agri]